MSAKQINTTYYLKYRPQSLGELVGQENVKQSLLSAFEKNRLSHAYLFSGPRGTGKTSTARILAKMVNCEGKAGSVKGEVPCNECANCISITDGSNLDLIEIDAASNRGIEDIRALREKIKLSPTNSKKKIYIIDEVHMLTTEAFNALLKTLEEPPVHALFILATTDPQKIPQTILSRVQRLDFRLASNEDLQKALQRIISSEKINIKEDALKFLAKKAEGSFRDGIKYLEQVSLIDEDINLKVLEENLNSSSSQVILDLLETFIKKDVKGALQLVTKQTVEGVDAKDLILDLMDSLRTLVFIKNGISVERLDLLKIAESFENKDLISSLDFLQKALEKMKTSSIPSLPLELAVVEICDISLHQKVEKRYKDSVVEVMEKATEYPTEGIGVFVDRQPDIQETIPSVENPTSDMQKLKEKWTYILETVRPFNFSLEALLRSSNIKECRESQVVLEVPYSFHQRILEAPKNRDLLESVFSDVLGRTIRITTELGARSPVREDIANIELAADDEIIRAAAEIFSSDTIN